MLRDACSIWDDRWRFNYIESFLATKELYSQAWLNKLRIILFFSNYSLIEARKLDEENRKRLIELEKLLF